MSYFPLNIMTDKFTEDDPETGLKFSQRVVKQKTTAPKQFENILRKVKVISGGKGNMLVEFEVEEEHRNSHGTLHGGIIATLVDAVTTWALHTAVKDGKSASVDLNISYMKPARVGQKILVDARSVKIGRRISFLKADIKSEDGTLYAQGKHTKIMLDPGSKL